MSSDSDSGPDLPGVGKVTLPTRRRRTLSSSSDEGTPAKQEPVKTAVPAGRPKGALPALGGKTPAATNGAAANGAAAPPAFSPPKSRPKAIHSDTASVKSPPPASSPVATKTAPSVVDEKRAATPPKPSPVPPPKAVETTPSPVKPVAPAESETSDIEFEEDEEVEQLTKTEDPKDEVVAIPTPPAPQPAPKPTVVESSPPPAAVIQHHNQHQHHKPANVKPEPASPVPQNPSAPARQPPPPPAAASPISTSVAQSPIHNRPPPSDEDEDDVLVSKAMTRIEKRTSRPASRATTPTRQQSAPRAASAARKTPLSLPATQINDSAPAPLANHQLMMIEASRDRLLRENVRLNDELTWMSKEHEKHRGAAERLVLLEREHASLQHELTSLKRNLDEVSREATRTKTTLEGKCRTAAEHAQQLEAELQTSHTTIAQFEGRLNEKDRAIAAEAATSATLRGDLRELSLEMKRVREDAARQRDEDQNRIEQISNILADAKKQRVVLLDLNDKFSREKEIAEADKRRALEELRTLQSSVDATRDKYEKEISQLRHDLDVQRVHANEREQQHIQEVTQLRIASDRLQEKLTQDAMRRDEAESRHKSSLTDLEARHKDLLRDLQVRLERAEQQRDSTTAKWEDAERRCLIVAHQRDEAVHDARRSAASEAQADLSLVQQRLRDVEHELSAAREQHNVTVSQLQVEIDNRLKSEESAARAKAKLASIRDAMDKLLASDDQMAEENETLHRRVAELEFALDRLHNEARGSALHAAHADELQIENDRLTAALNRATSDRDELTRELERLHAEVRSTFARANNDLGGASTSATTTATAAAARGSVPRSSRDFIY